MGLAFREAWTSDLPTSGLPSLRRRPRVSLSKFSQQSQCYRGLAVLAAHSGWRGGGEYECGRPRSRQRDTRERKSRAALRRPAVPPVRSWVCWAGTVRFAKLNSLRHPGRGLIWLVWNQRQINTRDVDDQSYRDANCPYPETRILMRTFPIRDVIVRISWRMRSLLWMVVVYLTHIAWPMNFLTV